MSDDQRFFYLPSVIPDPGEGVMNATQYGGYDTAEECLEHFDSAQLVCNHKLLDEVSDLKSLLENERRVGEGLYDVLTHAIELGYIGEGSTAGWAQEMLTNYEAVKYKR